MKNTRRQQESQQTATPSAGEWGTLKVPSSGNGRVDKLKQVVEDMK